MSETIKGLPEFDAQYKTRMDRESMHDLTKRNTVEQWERVACRERQLLAAIARAELAEAKLAAEVWISVEDLLPDCQQGMYLTLYLRWGRTFHRVSEWVGDKFVDLELHPVPVTHWRPLPSPPEAPTKIQP